MEDPNNIIWISILTAIISCIGAVAAIVSNLSKLKPERNKIEKEADSAIGDAAESIANGARVSNDLLLTRIVEMEVREKEREKIIAEVQKDFATVKAELLEWKDYAFRLAHQVKSLGHEPVPFRPVQLTEAGLKE